MFKYFRCIGTDYSVRRSKVCWVPVIQSISIIFCSYRSVARINSYIAEKTKGLINDTIKELKPEARLLIINAIHFKGTWSDEFYADNTFPGIFHQFDGTVIPCKYMLQSGMFLYEETSDVQAALFGFNESPQIRMMVILPKEKTYDGLNGCAEKYLSYDGLKKLTSAMRMHELSVELPKFKAKFSTSLKSVLKTMGLDHAFSDNATFDRIGPLWTPPEASSSTDTPMGSMNGLKISDVIHEAVFDVDEKGCEAAAVTVVDMEPLETCDAMDIAISFNVRHPFVVAIVNTETNLPLFSGIITEL